MRQSAIDVVSDLRAVTPSSETEWLMMVHGDAPVEPDTAHLDRVLEALEQLPDLYRELIYDRFFEQLSLRAIGAKHGRSHDWAQYSCVKATQLLKWILERDPYIIRRLNLFDNWNDACRMVVESYGRTPAAKQPLDRAELEQLATDLVGAWGNPDPSGAPLYAAAFLAVGELKRLKLWDDDDTVELLCRKQHDYGHRNISTFGLKGVAIRLHDKVARYLHLTSYGDLGSSAQNESLVDTLLDMVGYATVGEMLLTDTFMLDLKAAA